VRWKEARKAGAHVSQRKAFQQPHRIHQVPSKINFAQTFNHVPAPVFTVLIPTWNMKGFLGRPESVRAIRESEQQAACICPLLLT